LAHRETLGSEGERVILGLQEHEEKPGNREIQEIKVHQDCLERRDGQDLQDPLGSPVKELSQTFLVRKDRI